MDRRMEKKKRRRKKEIGKDNQSHIIEFPISVAIFLKFLLCIYDT